MAENIDGGKKRSKRERGGKRTINSLGELGSQPEIQDMLSAQPSVTPEALQAELEEIRDEIKVAPEGVEAEAAQTPPLEESVGDAQRDESETAPAASVEQESVAEPGVDQTGTGFINEPEKSEEAVWERLMRENPDGDADAFGRKAWLAPDGGVYLSRRNSKRPQYFAHGDKITFASGERKGQTMYWDTNTNSFDEARPQDVVDREEARAQERRLTTRERKLQTQLTEKEIETAQHNLRARLSRLTMDDSNRGVFSQGIDALKTKGHVEQISELLNQFDALKSRRAERAATSEVAPVEIVAETPAAPIEKENLEYAQGNLRNRLQELALDDETRAALSSQIAAATSSNDIVQLSKVIKRKETAARRASAAAARAEAASVVPESAPVETLPATEPVESNPVAESPAASTPDTEPAPDAAAVAAQVLSESPTPPRVETAPRPKKSPRDIVRERTLEERAKRRERLKAAVENVEPAQPAPEAHRLTEDALPEQPAASTKQAAETATKTVDYTVDHHKYDKYPPMSLTDILHDETHQQFFGELLHNIDPNASAAQLRFSQGTATKEDMALMTYATYEYRKWNSQWQQLSQILNEDDVMQFQRSVASLDNIASTVGRGRGLEILKNTLRHAAMRDQSAFLNIGHAVSQAHERRGGKQAQLAEQTVDDLAHQLGMSRAEFEKTIDLSTQGKEAVTKAEIEKRLRERATGPRKMMDWFTDKTGMTFGGSSAAAAEQAIKEGLYAVGQYRATGIAKLEELMGDEGIAQQVQLEARDKVPYRSGIEAGPKSFKDMQTEAQKVKQDDVEKVVREYIAQDPKWVSGGREYQDRALSDIKRKAQGALKAGDGFWAKILKFMFGDTFNKAATKATGRPVHVH